MTFDPASIRASVAIKNSKIGSRHVETSKGSALKTCMSMQKQGQGHGWQHSRSQTSGRVSTASQTKSPERESVSRSRDIVQEVYDRMGVNYVRGQSPFKFDDNKSAVSVPTSSVSKSPSRNKVSSRYSVDNHHQPTQEDTTDSDARSTRSNVSAGMKKVESHWAFRSTGALLDSHPVVTYPPSTRSMKYDDGRFPMTPRKNLPSNYQAKPKTEARQKEGREESRDDPQDNDRDVVSVKSRISAFNAFGEKTAASSKIGSGKKALGEGFSTHSHGLSVDTSGNYGNGQLHNTSSAKPGLVNSYLNAINKQGAGSHTIETNVVHGGNQIMDFPSKTVPTEIRQNDRNTEDDNHSIAASSVSGEDFGVSPSEKLRKASSIFRNTESFGLSHDAVVQMIEERVNAKIAEMTDTMEAQLRHVQETAQTRLDEIEEKVNELVTAKQTSVSDGSKPPSGDREQFANEYPPTTKNNYYRPFRR